MSSFVFYWHSDGNLHSEKVIEDDKVLVLINGWYYIATKISQYVIFHDSAKKVLDNIYD